ncbi:hypothetical protein B7494_g8319 [Chlorociboria aeruginascens]|nr:hypothetical protein B7494_g8319 [Chlorociboria aeruginascens]
MHLENNTQPTSNGHPTPNHGASINANSAIPSPQSLSTWRQDHGIDVSAQVKLVKLSHMRYQHVDLEKVSEFLKDFGMHIVKKTEDKVWWAGYGNDQYVYVAEKGAENKFLGGVFAVESEADLEKASHIPGALEIENLSTAPGGGKRLTILDPEGFPFGLIHGQSTELEEQRSYPEKLIYNYEDEKTRRNQFQRFKEGPAAVHKLGHFGLCVTDFPAQWQFYTKHFNIVPTDWLYIDSANGPKDAALFAHIDRGEDYVDHHSFFLSSNPTSHVHHCSFEVHDFDTQLLGHKSISDFIKNTKSDIAGVLI